MIDFIRLYRELGIAPDCSLDTFKQAYRRRVGELHPDRTDDNANAVSTLKDLNLCYSAALDFHRQHGRLPGSLPHAATTGTAAGNGRGTGISTPTAGLTPTTTSQGGAAGPAPFRSASRASASSGSVSAASTPSGTSSPRRRRPPPPSPAASDPKFLHSRKFWLVAGVLLLAAVWYFSNLPSDDADRRYEQLPPAAGADSATPLHLDALALGMPGGDVARLLGEPVGRDEDSERWIYGPSWVEFECDRVVDWYSSRLKPLPVDAPRPEHARQAPHDKRRGDHCPPSLLREAGVVPSPAHPPLHTQGS